MIKKGISSLNIRDLCSVLVIIIFFVFSQTLGQENDSPCLSLEECIKLTLKNNPQYISFIYKVLESKERINEVRAEFLPAFGLNASANKNSDINNNEGRSLIFSKYNLGISTGYTLYKGWKNLAAIDAARYNYRSVFHQHESSQQDIILQVKQTYYRLLQAEHLIQAADKFAQRTKLHMDFANARFEAGLASRSDVLKAKVELSNANLSLIRIRNKRLFIQGELNVLIGQEPYKPIKIIDNLEHLDWNETMELEKIMEQAINNRPEIKMIEAQLFEQKSNIRQIGIASYPSVSMDINYNWKGLIMSQLDNKWFAGLSLSYPIFM